MIWTDNMLIPKGGDVYTASTYMNYVYSPAIAAKIAAYVNYICPVDGRRSEVLAKTDPEMAKNPLIFPTRGDARAASHQIDPTALNNQNYKRAVAGLLGA